MDCFKFFTLSRQGMSTTDEQKYDGQVAALQERFPRQAAAKLLRLLLQNHGDVDQVCGFEYRTCP